MAIELAHSLRLPVMGAWAIGVHAAWGAKQGMDAFIPILSQTAGANSAGQSSAPDAADAGAFDALLASQTAPVTPVPAIPSRPNGTNAFLSTSHAAMARHSASGTLSTTATPSDGAGAVPTPANTATGQGAAVQPTSMMSANAGAITQPASATTGGHLQGHAMPQPGAATPVAADTGVQTPGTPSSPSSPLITGGQPTVAPNPSQGVSHSGSTVTGSAVTGSDAGAKGLSGQSAASTVNAKVNSGTFVKNNVTPAANGTANSGEMAGSNGADAVKANAGTQPSASNAVAGAAAQTSDGQVSSVVASTTPQPVVQAGVQARREAAGPEKAPIAGNAKSTASGSTGGANATSSSASATTTQSAKPGITIPAQTAAPQTTQPPAEAPLDPARLAVSDTARSAPPPVDAGQTDAGADAERVDLSNSRAADMSRAAERPGVAAGTARFTPAHAGTLAAQIAAKFQNGDRKFEIRMDPPELGRIQVKMHVGNDNRVQAILSAERPETLNDLRQHARELERALEESGLQLDNDGLSFELSQGSDQDEPMTRNLPGFTNIEFAEDLAGPITAAALPRELYGFQLSSVSRVDVRL